MSLLEIFLSGKVPIINILVHICLLSLVPHLGHKTPLKRILKALLWSLCALPLCFISGQWFLLLAQLLIALVAQLILGCFNPLVAPREEFFIYFLMTVLQPVMLL